MQLTKTERLRNNRIQKAKIFDIPDPIIKQSLPSIGNITQADQNKITRRRKKRDMEKKSRRKNRR